MTSEGSCDTEDWSIYAEISAHLSFIILSFTLLNIIYLFMYLFIYLFILILM